MICEANMLVTKRIGIRAGRTVATTMTVAAAITLVGAAGVAAAPGTGSSGSSDSGSSSGSGGSGSSIPRSKPCNQSTQSGGAGVTETVHHLGTSGPTSFVLAYETYDIPDQIEVFYQGGLVHNTGYIGDDINQGTGSVVVALPPGTETSVLVRVTGPGGTDWEYTVNCPIR
ncbi:hypothetical protein GV791_08955 [Nocardia cyriacigeorgica]|uniref:Uncharacterized protein n=1 Tax=Nocardia cyriacigeorgica TaxID=135487 RepID=A0A6P1CJA3_9NOCA|nr:hypothetical protein [Nocardia cyriacigeorgica]NEW32689.1 hypothetical protein [Nocardia cyriacigeorgica]PPJ03654.1 hypothetical protein C5E43_25045 [Nocardia cyriacigeorgica]